MTSSWEGMDGMGWQEMAATIGEERARTFPYGLLARLRLISVPWLS